MLKDGSFAIPVGSAMSAITILPEGQLSEPNLDSPSAVFVELANALQVLVTLHYLIEKDRNDPNKVLQHVRMTDGPITRIANLTRQAIAWPKSNDTAQ